MGSYTSKAKNLQVLDVSTKAYLPPTALFSTVFGMRKPVRIDVASIADKRFCNMEREVILSRGCNGWLETHQSEVIKDVYREAHAALSSDVDVEEADENFAADWDESTKIDTSKSGIKVSRGAKELGVERIVEHRSIVQGVAKEIQVYTNERTKCMTKAKVRCFEGVLGDLVNTSIALSDIPPVQMQIVTRSDQKSSGNKKRMNEVIKVDDFCEDSLTTICSGIGGNRLDMGGRVEDVLSDRSRTRARLVTLLAHSESASLLRVCPSAVDNRQQSLRMMRPIGGAANIVLEGLAALPRAIAARESVFSEDGAAAFEEEEDYIPSTAYHESTMPPSNLLEYIKVFASAKVSARLAKASEERKREGGLEEDEGDEVGTAIENSKNAPSKKWAKKKRARTPTAKEKDFLTGRFGHSALVAVGIIVEEVVRGMILSQRLKGRTGFLKLTKRNIQIAIALQLRGASNAAAITLNMVCENLEVRLLIFTSSISQYKYRFFVSFLSLENTHIHSLTLSLSLPLLSILDPFWKEKYHTGMEIFYKIIA